MSEDLCSENRLLRQRVAVVASATCCALAAIQIRRLISNGDNWVSSGGTSVDKVQRTSARGSVTSLGAALTLGMVSTLVDMTCKVDTATSATLMSMIFGNTVGFVLDAAIGSDAGLALTKESVAKGLHAALSDVSSPNFVRYMITVIMDAQLSSVLLDQVLKRFIFVDQSTGRGKVLTQFFRCSPTSKLVPKLVTIAVGVLTFYTYTNATRFRYAILNNEFPVTVQEYAKRAVKTHTFGRSVFDEKALGELLTTARRPESTWESIFGASRDEVRRGVFEEQDDMDDQTLATLRTLSKELESPRQSKLDPDVVHLMAAVVSVVYLSTTVGSNRGVHHPMWKTVSAALQLALITAVTMRGMARKAPAPPSDRDAYTGTLIFAAIAAACVGGTFYTSTHPDRKTMATILAASFVLSMHLGSKAGLPYTRRGQLPIALALGGSVVTFMMATNTTPRSMSARILSPKGSTPPSADSAVPRATEGALRPRMECKEVPRTNDLSPPRDALGSLATQHLS
jgi:hypothetical protein